MLVRQFSRRLCHNNGILRNSAEIICNGVLPGRRLSSSPEELSYRYQPGNIPLVDMTIGQLIERTADNWPNREALVSIPQGIRMTYRDVIKRVDKIAAGLKKLGLKPGDRVGIWGPNNVEWYLGFFALTRGGFVVVAINPAYQQEEFNNCTKRVGVRAVIACDKFKTQDYVAMINNSRAAVPSIQHVIFWSQNHVPGAHRLVDIENLPDKIDVEAIGREQDVVSPYDICNIQFTSGTTGAPKAPLLLHRSFVNNGIQMAEREGRVKDHSRICLNVPFFHAFGTIRGLMAGIYSGSTLVLESLSFDPRASIDAIAKEKCTHAFGTPTMWINMVGIQGRVQGPMDSMRAGVIGGATATPELLKTVKTTFGLEALTILYGLTECTAAVYQSSPGEPEELATDTVGHLHPHLEAKVVDEKGAQVPLGTPGELLVRGYSLMLRYWDNPAATAEMIDEDGWLKTGDKFIMRKDGYGHIVGRIKDIIIRGGENIYPKEVENFLESHPAVAEAHVFGVHDDFYGEEIFACVRLKDNANVRPDELKSFGKGKISHFKIPRYIKVVTEFPKTTSGKIQKFRLREEMERENVLPVKKKV